MLESVDSRDGVWDLEAGFEEHLDEGVEFKFSSGISSLLTLGLPSLDLGVPECDRGFDPSRVFELEGVFIGDDFDELRRFVDSLKKKVLDQVPRFLRLQLTRRRSGSW